MRISDTCRRGHPRIPENVWVSPSTGYHVCLVCKNSRDRNIENKTCEHCGISLPLTPPRRYCTECAPDRRSYNMLDTYNLCKSDYDAMYFEQDGNCAICGIEEGIYVDHDHRCCPGKKSCGRCVRALTCHGCNTAIGLFKENKVSIQRAIDYLEEWE